ncbi:MAG: glycosyltransferase [Nitrospirae bacterium]|nr:glycosyltransferase [Nitrospirota bacterium]
MDSLISVIIPNHNGTSTIGKCLEAAFSSRYDNFEVIVVDDCSTDNSVEIIKRFPCKLIQLDKHSGASRTRNVGAHNSTGDILFFIDSDCILQEDALSIAYESIRNRGNTVIGGTYARLAYDDNFFGTFQAIFVNYHETKRREPDYIAAHAMIIESKVFKESGGFPEDFLPIIEDVEFTHRLRRSGYKLIMNPEILVRHIFNFTLIRSFKNAFRKTTYWTIYSLKNRDIFKDSGTASLELKTNVVTYFLNLFLIMLSFLLKQIVFLTPIPLIFFLNLFVNRNLLRMFYDTKGLFFFISSVLYYTMIYSLSVGIGSFMGMVKYLLIYRHREGYN